MAQPQWSPKPAYFFPLREILRILVGGAVVAKGERGGAHRLMRIGMDVCIIYTWVDPQNTTTLHPKHCANWVDVCIIYTWVDPQKNVFFGEDRKQRGWSAWSNLQTRRSPAHDAGVPHLNSSLSSIGPWQPPQRREGVTYSVIGFRV